MTFQYPIKRLVLSHSARSTARRCMRIFEFSKMYGDPKMKEEQFAAEVGKALHVGFQDYLVHKNENHAIMAFVGAYPYELEYNKYENATRSLEASFATLEALINSEIPDRYELIHIKTQLKDNPILPAVEVPFAFEITGAPLPIPIYFVGFTDAILFDKVEKKYLVSDIKTHRLSPDDLSVKFEFDEQTVPYGIVLEHILGHKIEEFEVSYLSTYIDLLNPKVQMYKFTKTQDHVHDWYRGLCEDILRISQYYKAQFWPRATSGDVCFSFNRPCWYAGECSNRDPEITSKLLNTTIRDGLFHDNTLPWVSAKLDWINPYA
jgi:hypothetical protein